MTDTDHQLCLVTGASSGLGRALAAALVGRGHTVVLLARDANRGAAAAAELRRAGGHVEFLQADLADLASVRQAAKDFLDRHPRPRLLVNNAAVYLARREVTGEGFERMFATNHLGPFLLTHLLLDALRAAGASRILNITAPSTVRPDFDDLQSTRRFRSLNAFGATKTANLLFTFALARRLEGSGVTANAVHPGVARTGLMRQAPAPMRWLTSLMGSSANRAVEPVVRVATDPSFAGRNGRFFHKAVEIDPPAQALDTETQERLWRESLRLAGLPRQALAAQ